MSIRDWYEVTDISYSGKSYKDVTKACIWPASTFIFLKPSQKTSLFHAFTLWPVTVYGLQLNISKYVVLTPPSKSHKYLSEGILERKLKNNYFQNEI